MMMTGIGCGESRSFSSTSKPLSPRHVQVEDDAVRATCVEGVKELVAAGKALTRKPAETSKRPKARRTDSSSSTIAINRRGASTARN